MTTPTLQSYMPKRTRGLGEERYQQVLSASRGIIDRYLEEASSLGIFPGTCFCKCGTETGLAKNSVLAIDILKGFPNRYCAGHQNVGVSQKKPRHFDSSYYTVKNTGYKTDCWIWNRSTDSYGYGTFRVNAKKTRVHRYTFETVKGLIPRGFEVDHLCRVPGCINPDHLEAVTKAENIRRGASAKLTHEKAREIRRLRAEGVTAPVIAKMFGIIPNHVYKVQYGIVWAES